MTTTTFDGETIDHARDTGRLQCQLNDVKRFMSDNCWHSLNEIANRLGHPESSISARLRDLRKPKFGAYNVERRYIEKGLFQYRVNVFKETLFE